MGQESLARYVAEPQRGTVPFDDPDNSYQPRQARGIGATYESRGGLPCPPALPRRTYEPLPGSGATYYPGTPNDQGILRDRTPWYHKEFQRTGVDSGLVNWTHAGPIRAELHMRNASLRTMQGNDHTISYQDPDAPYTRSIRADRPGGGWRILQNQGKGLHTNPKPGITYTNARYQSPNPLMVAPRVNRLASSVYTGQSYSQTTELQGG